MNKKNDINAYMKNLSAKWDAEMQRRMNAIERARNTVPTQHTQTQEEQKPAIDISLIVDKLNKLNELTEELLITVKIQANTDNKILEKISELNEMISKLNTGETIVEDIP